MGKRKQAASYVHAVNYNPRAHESDDRRGQLLQSLELKRHEKNVARLKENLLSYVPEDAKVIEPIAPEYRLKGAARPAQLSYLPPNYQEPPQPVDIFEQYKARLYDHDVGKEYLCALRDLGLCFGSMNKKTKDAANIFQVLLRHDPNDHLSARDHLLRCYMSAAWGDKARQVIEIYPQHKSSCFAYNQVLLDIISLQLKEEGSSIATVHESIAHAIAANPFTAWTIAYAEIFSNVLEQTDLIDINAMPYGSIEDAIKYFEVEYELWEETDGAVAKMQGYILSHRDTCNPNIAAMIEAIESQHDTLTNKQQTHIMYLRMFETGVEMILAEEEKPAAMLASNSKTSNKKKKV